MNSRTFLYSVGLLVAAAAVVSAGEPASGAATAGYHLKNRSFFTAPAEARVPFWPIGWAPSSSNNTTRAEAPAADLEIKAEQFNVTSILLGSKSLAVINGRTYGEGEMIRATKAAKKTEGAAVASNAGPPPGAKIRVQRITDGEVLLQSGSQALSVPLRRQQLSEPKQTDDDLLSLNGDR